VQLSVSTDTFNFAYVSPSWMGRAIIFAPMFAIITNVPLIAITLRDNLILLVRMVSVSMRRWRQQQRHQLQQTLLSESPGVQQLVKCPNASKQASNTDANGGVGDVVNVNEGSMSDAQLFALLRAANAAPLSTRICYALCAMIREFSHLLRLALFCLLLASL
jgi:hypothetical protein